jgi:hypothetical protein
MFSYAGPRHSVPGFYRVVPPGRAIARPLYPHPLPFKNAAKASLPASVRGVARTVCEKWEDVVQPGAMVGM